MQCWNHMIVSLTRLASDHNLRRRRRPCSLRFVFSIRFVYFSSNFTFQLNCQPSGRYCCPRLSQCFSYLNVWAVVVNNYDLRSIYREKRCFFRVYFVRFALSFSLSFSLTFRYYSRICVRIIFFFNLFALFGEVEF